MNRKKIKGLPLTVFLIGIGTVIYTWFGILELGRQGGPCNGGLAFIILIPMLFICVVAQTVSIYGASKTNSDKITMPVILSVVSFLLWTYWVYTFSQDSLRKSLLYMGPFEAFSILVLILSVWKVTQTKEQFFDERDNIQSI